MAANGEAAGLFAAPGSPEMSHGGASKAKRTKLYPTDHVAVKLFDPYGPSTLSEHSLKDLWKATAAGGKNVAFHSHLAADLETQPWKVGTGISVTCAALLAGIAGLEKENIVKLLKPELLKKAMDEAAMLKPALEVLNFGKGSEGNKDRGTTMSSLKRQKNNEGAAVGVGRRADADSVRAAVATLHEWLSKPNSALRGILMILAGDGVFYAAHAAEKVARSCVHHKPADKAHLTKAALTRNSTAADPEEKYDPNTDVQGLMEEGEAHSK